MDWKDGALGSVTIQSRTGRECTVRYKDKTRELELKPGNKIKLTEKDFQRMPALL